MSEEQKQDSVDLDTQGVDKKSKFKKSTNKIKTDNKVDNGVNFDDISMENSTDKTKEQDVSVAIKTKSDKKALTLSVIAILISFGFAGYSYMVQQQVGGRIQGERNNFNDRVSTLEKTLSNNSFSDLTNSMDSKFEVINTTVSDLVNQNKNLAERVDELSRKLSLQVKLNESLQNKVNKVSEQSSSQLDKIVEVPQQLLLVQATYLVQNAQNELLTSGNSQVVIELLKQADGVLSESTDPRALSARNEIAQDISNVSNNIDIDTNFISNKLYNLTSKIDNLVLSVGETTKTPTIIINSKEISDNVGDWKENIKKSIASFMSNFITITPKTIDGNAVFVAPEQDFYLRENIRFSLQMAILATYKGQNELYHKSLGQVASWIRSYFDMSGQDTIDFLISLDKLMEISLDVEKTVELKSVKALNILVNSKE